MCATAAGSTTVTCTASAPSCIFAASSAAGACIMLEIKYKDLGFYERTNPRSDEHLTTTLDYFSQALSPELKLLKNKVLVLAMREIEDANLKPHSK